MPRFHLRHLSLFIGCFLILIPLHAQDGDSIKEDESVFVLPEFIVSADNNSGYQATNSLTGTFLDTSLKDSPFAIDVFMPDLIADTGSTDMREILAYDSGLQLENTIAAQGDGNYSLGVEFDARGINNTETDIVTRGFRAPTLKNGFFTETRVDTVNVARVERAGGPQSLLYGIGAISGITNVITKRPLSEPLYITELFVGSNDFYRATAEATGPIYSADDKQLDYIVTLAYQEDGTEYPWETNETLFVSPAFQFRGWDMTTIYLSFEKGWREQAGTGKKDAPHPRAGIINPQTGGPSGTRVTGEDATLLEDFLGMGHYVNLGGPDATIEDDVLTTYFELTQKLGQHFRLLLALNRDEQERDEQKYTFGPSLRQRFNPDGSVAFEDLIFAFGNPYEDRVTEQARLALLGSFEFLGGQHSFVVGRQEFSQQVTNIEFPESSIIEANNAYTAWPADGSSIRYRGEPLTAPTWQNRFKEWYQGNYVIYQGSIWNGRINPVLGYRWDRSHTEFLRANFLEDGSFGEVFDPLTDRGSVNGKANGGEPFQRETPTAGLSISVTDQLSVYASYAEGTALSNIAQRDGLDRGFPPEFTTSREVGAKVSFWDGKISGRITFFELEKEGGVRYSFYAPNPSRGNFNPDEPITAALRAGTASSPGDLRKFMDYIGAYDLESGSFSVLPLDLPGVERVIIGDNAYFIFPYGTTDNPGFYDLGSNAAPNGFGGDLLAYIQVQRELAAAGLGGEAPQYMWASQGNHPGEDRGAYHNFDELSEGIELRLQVSPIQNWQMIFSYTYNKVTISKGLSGLVNPELITGLEPWFWYLPPEDFADPTKPSSYNGSLSSGVVNTDVPLHSFTFWTKYEFVDGFLEGFDLRFGARYTSERAAESPWSNGGAFVDAINRGVGDNVKAPVPAFTLYDIGLGYEWDWKDITWRINLNVRNLLDEKELVAVSSATTVFGQPELTRYYIEGRDIRLSLRLDF
jgi:outer membrane receptor protein involved in Fe transport